MPFDSLLSLSTAPALTAFILGLMTVFSPCPFCSDLAAVSYMCEEIGSRRSIQLKGLLYCIGKMLAYCGLSVPFILGLQIHPVRQFFETHGHAILGPVLIIAAILLWISGRHHHTEGAGKCSAKKISGAFFLGFMGALAFCPYSGIIYFGAFIPLILAQPAGHSWYLPVLFSIATILPVVVISVLIALGTTRIDIIASRINKIEKPLRILSIVLLFVIGVISMIPHHHTI